MEQSLLFLVDRTWGTLEPSQADTLMEAAASISQALCDQGVSFRLCWNHGETIERFDVTQERLPEAVGGPSALPNHDRHGRQRVVPAYLRRTQGRAGALPGNPVSGRGLFRSGPVQDADSGTGWLHTGDGCGSPEKFELELRLS